MRVKLVVVLLSALSIPSGLAGAEETMKLEDPRARASYSLGYQMGQDLKRQGVTLDGTAILGGLEDGRSGAEPRIPDEQMRALLAELKQRIVQQKVAKRRAESDAIKQAGIEFLEQNRSKPGVRTTDSGLQYKVVKEGSGKRPGPTDRVRVHYRGTTVEGQVFDDSRKRGQPAEFALNGVIKGWTEGLQLMQEGATYELYIPYDLAYNHRGPLAFQALIFEVELLEVNPPPPQATAPASGDE
jgi:FKBP-type peptidyl-prolyl cis-trans isomerase FklB